jgi:IS5 family transposase
VIDMLILDYPEWSQPTVAQGLIPEAAYKLTPELEKIDKLLQDESYEDPIVERFNTQRGRPTVPVRVYIRMMFLKHYTGLSYEDLVPEVTHNLMYRFFCRIPLEQKVPDPTALMKITTRYGEEVIEEMNRNLLKALVQKKLLRDRRTRIDSTVVEANIAHPTDAGLLYEGVRKLTKAVARIKQACGKVSRQSTTSIRRDEGPLVVHQQSTSPQDRGCPYRSSENHRSYGGGSPGGTDTGMPFGKKAYS